MKRLKVVTIIFILLCISIEKVNASNNDDKINYSHLHSEDYIDVSIIQLLANPEKYNGKYVRVIGFLNLEFEGDAVYLHKEDYLASIAKNGLWVHVNRFKLKNATKCIKKYVIIEAIFDAEDRGHDSAFGGALKNIIRLDLWHQAAIKK